MLDTIQSVLRSEILGINARNLLYIRPFNSRRAMQLADSKLRTKVLLEGRGIPVTPLLGVIRSTSELEGIDWKSFNRSFVIKPNRGFGGEGIYVTKRRKGGTITDLRDVPVDKPTLDAHVRSILDGRYSMGNLPDIAIIEQKIVSPPLLREYAPHGLPDIRIIVFNLIPVIAMLRLPTAESGGKANLHQGGVAVGIDLETGTGTYGYHQGAYVDHLPGTNVAIRSLSIPGWNRILLLASRVQRISNVGYLAVDIALNRHENPLVLEMNARGGLSIQLANRVALRGRLERAGNFRVKNPEHGVRLGRELFGSQIEREIERISGREVLGRVERVVIKLPGQREHSFLAQVDVTKIRSVLDTTLATSLGFGAEVPPDAAPGRTPRAKVRFTLGAKELRTDVHLRDLADSKYKMVIGARDLVDFLIDPLKKVAQEEEPLVMEPSQPVLPPMQFVDPKEVDGKLHDLDRQLRVLAQLRPINARAELERFLVDPSMNPRFLYPPQGTEVDEFERQLRRLQCGRGILGEIFSAKCDELLRRVSLLRAIGTPALTEASLALYPTGSPEDQADARRETIIPVAPTRRTLLSTTQLVEEVQSFLWQLGLDWEVRVGADQASDFSVSKGHTLFVRKGVRATRERLRGTIAHEIETHIFTTENGLRQPYRIFSYGFANFLFIQEGLADAIKQRTVSRSTSTSWSLIKYLAILDAQQYGFAKVAELSGARGLTLRQAFNLALRCKRGLVDTGAPGGFTKDGSYWLGRRQVEAWAAAGNDLRQLFIGKVNLGQLPLALKIPGVLPPRLLPVALLAG